jgi:hypothetical protein
MNQQYNITPKPGAERSTQQKGGRLPWQKPCVIDLGVECTETGIVGFGNENSISDTLGSFLDS